MLAHIVPSMNCTDYINMEKEKKKLECELIRKDGKTFFLFTIDERLQKFYIKGAEEVRESQNWNGLKFYYVPDIIENQTYIRLLQQHNLIDNFGSSIIVSGKFNIAWIRTEGGTGQIEIKEQLPLSELSLMMTNVRNFLKSYFEEFLREINIKTVVSIES